MTKRFLVLATLLSLGVATGCNDLSSPIEAGTEQTTALAKHSSETAPDYDGYIVVLNDDVSANEVEAIASNLGNKHHGNVDHAFKHALKGFSVKLSKSDLDELKKDHRVKHVEPNYIISIDPSTGPSASGKRRSGTITPAPTTGTTPWGVAYVGGPHDGTGRTAWIIDTGIDFENSDLNVDIARSRNFVSDGQTADDVYGHGTHVAGTVGARNNTIGVTGVAPNATLVSVRVLDNTGYGTYAAIIAGVDYVAANGEVGDVANMSLGGPASSALDAAVLNAASLGIRFSIAAGNSSTSATTISPARVEHPNVYTVSAHDQSAYFASFSNYGNPPVDYSAPGVNILSTANGGGTTTKSGTSMAAPHVCGLLLLNSIRANGTVRNDPDGTADPLAHY
jgi:hypothetical protein